MGWSLGLAAKRGEYVARNGKDERGTSGQRRAVQPRESEAPRSRRPAGERGAGRPVSDSVPAGSILDRLGYLPSSARDTWSSDLGPPSTASLAAAADDATTPPPQTLRDQLQHSGGFYSRVVPSVESVSIPRPPRLPDLDPMDASLAPPPGSDTPPAAGRRPLPARSLRPEAILIPPLLRRQADEWRQTGSLNLPSTVSSRHARALQRALLLSMLQSDEFSHLPEGIAQRAAWMFREGWGEGKKARDADDLCFVLGLSAGPSARTAVIAAANAHIPAESILPPSSARWSSRPPRPDR